MRAVHIGMVHQVDDIRIVRKECAALAEFEIETMFLTQSRGEDYSGEKICGVSIYTYKPYRTKMRIPYLSVRIWKKVSCRRCIRKALALDGDIYHIHEVELYDIARSLNKKRKKIIFDQHEDSPGQAFQAGIEKFKNKIPAIILKNKLKYQERVMLKSCESVIAASDHIGENLRQYNIDKPITVIHNYADADSTRCEMDDYLKRKNIVCYAGGLFERRGIAYVVKAMEKVDGIFEIAGEMTPQLEDMYTRLTGWEKCRYLGKLNRDEVNQLYGRSKVGVINNIDVPYHRNSNPNKLFEYMAAGIPIICTSIPTWAKIVKDAKCGLIVQADNPKEIAEAINYIFNNPMESEQMGENGYQAFASKYNWECESKKLLDIYGRFKKNTENNLNGNKQKSQKMD